MEMLILCAVLTLVLANLPLSSALPMTDYSQLNHDEPTHWTKAATTHAPSTAGAEWQISRKQPMTSTLPTGETTRPSTSVPSHDSTTNESNTRESQIITLSLQGQNDITTKSMVFDANGPTSDYVNKSEALVREELNFEKLSYIEEGITQSVKEHITNQNLNLSEIISHTAKVNSSSNYSENVTTNSPPMADNYEDIDDKPLNFEQYYRYDLVDDIRKMFPSDTELSEKQDISDSDLDKALNNFRKVDDIDVPADDAKNQIHKFDYNSPDSFDSEQEEEEMRRDDIKPKNLYDSLAIPTLSEIDENYDADTPFKKWDRDSEEQEKLLENIVFQANNDTFDKMEFERTESSSEEQTGGGRWFLLLLAGNSTIVRLRQKDFAKYLKLNLAARLSLEYDEVKLNKVVLAPPRLMVNVSVVPSGMGNLDEEFDLNERLFGEEEAPLHKLAETNATLLELSGEEYHVVRFLSLRSQQPLAIDEVASETSIVINDRHADIERVVYVGIGTGCIFLIIPLVVALCRLYLVPMKIKWPWKRDKPLFSTPWTLPRHQRMEEPPAPIGGPLTVIYSGTFVERNGPPTGTWLEDRYQSSSILQDEPNIENPVYGLSALETSTVQDICGPSIVESPKFNSENKIKKMNVRPNHLLIKPIISRCDFKTNQDGRIIKGLVNPNYQT